MAGSHRRAYYWNFAALLVLLGAAVGVSFLSLGAAGPWVAMGIAAAKALLVALFFMHLADRGGVTRLFAAGGLVWLGLLFLFTFGDYAARGGEVVESYSWSEAEGAPAGAPAPLPEARPGLRRRQGGSVVDR